MKSEHLHDLWEAPDNTRLLSKQFSFRFPTHIAAKINALCEMYPKKNRTQIVADLLSTALDDLESKLPYEIYESEPYIQDEFARMAYNNREAHETVYQIGGIRAKFRSLTNKHFIEYEKELGNESQEDLYTTHFGSKEYLKSIYK